MKKLFCILTTVLLVIGMSSCCKCKEADPYKEFTSSGLQVKSFATDFENYDLFGYDKMQLITDYETFDSYEFGVSYTEEYFEENNLLVFVVSSCSSDGMVFQEVLEYDGKLYPCFLRNQIGKNEPVTEDFILYSACVELPKDSEYKEGEIIFKYREKSFWNTLKYAF